MSLVGLYNDTLKEVTLDALACAENHIVLMHKNIPVAEYKIDGDTGRIINDITVLEPEHLPLPVQISFKNNRMAAEDMQEWVSYRSVPRSRNDFASLLKKYSVSTASAAAYKSLGLNLSDQYWFKPKGADLDWKNINLFQNDFLKQDFESSTEFNTSVCSPDTNSNGELPKFWCVENGRRMLYKQGSKPFYQQPYNEVFASRLLDKLELDHVQYALKPIKAKLYSVCETFVTANTEYIPALDVLTAKKKSNSDSSYTHFFRCLDLLNVEITKNDINNMLVFDNIINNVDRHYGNFGYIRDAESLKFIKFAPIFDNGNSLWYDALDYDVKLGNQQAKPFRDKQKKQITLVDEFSLPISELSENFIQETAFDTFSSAIKSGKRITEERLNKIIQCVNNRVRGILYLTEKYNKIYDDDFER